MSPGLALLEVLFSGEAPNPAPAPRDNRDIGQHTIAEMLSKPHYP